MLTRQVDGKERIFRPIPISYLIQTANQFDCDIYVTNDKTAANIKRYNKMKNSRMTGFLTFYFKGGDELEAEGGVQSILWKDK